MDSRSNRIWTVTYKGYEISHCFSNSGLKFEHWILVELEDTKHRFSELKDAERYIDNYIFAKKLEKELNETDNGTTS